MPHIHGFFHHSAHDFDGAQKAVGHALAHGDLNAIKRRTESSHCTIRPWALGR